MKKNKNRQEVKRLLREFLKQLRSMLMPKLNELTLDEFTRIESKCTKAKMKGNDAKYF